MLAEVAKWTPRNPATGRLKFLVRPAYVSPVLSRQTGVTMGFLRFRRWTHVVWGPGTSSGDAQFAYLLRGHLGAIPIRPGPLPSAEPIRPRAGPKNPRHDLALGEYRWYMAEQRREVEAAAANRRQPRAVQPSLWGECPASVV